MEMESKAIKARTGILEGNAGTMKSLTKAQEATGKAHIVVQGGILSNTSTSAMATIAALKKKSSSSSNQR